MTTANELEKIQACTAAGWEVENNTVFAYGLDFPLTNPLAIHLKTYRVHASHDTRVQAMRAAFNILWPHQVITYNYWMERMFREHCDFNTDVFSVAGGGGIGKTQTAAYIAAIFWLALPYQRAVIVTSTTLESLKSRIYGYVLRALNEISVSVPFSVTSSPAPTIHPIPIDHIHGIYGLAAKLGKDEDTIKNIIGRHPQNALMLILDEAPDMPMALINAMPNLKKGLQDRFQCIAIGNSNKVTDLHGSLSTPKVGWPNIDPAIHFRWETTQPRGICLYFNPYDSPAIHEPDEKKKKRLGKFLMTEEKLKQAEYEEGKESAAFWRMTMGYWKFRENTNTIVTEEFLKDYDPTTNATFSGKYPLVIVAGLDPAFTAGGDKCLLRLAILGQHVNGTMILDFKNEHLIFKIDIRANCGKSAEIQIAEQVLAILKQHNIRLDTLCIDASGGGRGIAEIIQLKSGTGLTPTNIFSTNISFRHGYIKSRVTNLLDGVISSSHEMWHKGREFISHKQIFGLDSLAYRQLHTRQIVSKKGKLILEPKGDYKKRMSGISSLLGNSPDEADSAMLALQSAIIHHGFFPGQTRPLESFKTEDLRKFEIARAAYIEKFTPSTQHPFTLNATYKNGLASLLQKRMF